MVALRVLRCDSILVISMFVNLVHLASIRYLNATDHYLSGQHFMRFQDLLHVLIYTALLSTGVDK